MPLSAIQTDYTPGRPGRQSPERRRHADDSSPAVSSAAAAQSVADVGLPPGIADDTTAAIVDLTPGSAVTFDLAVRRYAFV